MTRQEFAGRLDMLQQMLVPLLHEDLHRCISELDESQRQIIEMYYLQGMSADEIAQALDKKLGWVWVSMERARMALLEKTEKL